MKALFYTIIYMLISSQPVLAVDVVSAPNPFGGSKLFVPADQKPHAGILVLHGSEGGSMPFAHIDAMKLASRGFAVLAFCWYNCNKSPMNTPYDMLKDIKLEDTVKALNWLRNSPQVGGKKVGIYGVSRGAEQTIILGSLLGKTAESPKAIAVHSPSDVAVDGFSWNWADKRCFFCNAGDLSCFNNSDDPFAWDWENMKWHPICGEPPPMPGQKMPTAWLWNDKPLVTGSRIEIENFSGDVFITHGTKDEWWKPERSLNIEKTLKSVGRTPELHIFEGEMHNFKREAEEKRMKFMGDFFVRVLN